VPVKQVEGCEDGSPAACRKADGDPAEA